MNTPESQHESTDIDEPSPGQGPISDSNRGFRGWLRESFRPFRSAVLRGFAVLLPPLLTILLFAWAWNTIDQSIIRPAEALSARYIVWRIADIRDNVEVQKALAEPDSAYASKMIDGTTVVLTDRKKPLVRVGRKWIPAEVVATVDEHPGETSPVDARQYYLRYAELTYLERRIVIPIVLVLFLGTMYLFGKLLAAGVGRMFWRFFESVIDRLPIIRNVYSSVKQVTDFAFTDNSIGETNSPQFNRVVALEYPRKGIWSIGFVTGESLVELRTATGEPMLSVLMPTSPMPATGFTVSIPKSQTIELDLTIDQAIQFCVSCGVVVPDHQNPKLVLETQAKSASKGFATPAIPPVTDYKDASSGV
ncbi:DUF502 domain-containing protein [Mariniblastus sp.]|nr:DUF502 domain-containing protein [Mariniblastus sp.]